MNLNVGYGDIRMNIEFDKNKAVVKDKINRQTSKFNCYLFFHSLQCV